MSSMHELLDRAVPPPIITGDHDTPRPLACCLGEVAPHPLNKRPSCEALHIRRLEMQVHEPEAPGVACYRAAQEAAVSCEGSPSGSGFVLR